MAKSAYGLACLINRRHGGGRTWRWRARAALGEALRMSVSKRSQLSATNNNADDLVVDDDELGAKAVLYKVPPQTQTAAAATAFIDIQAARGVVDSLQCPGGERMSMTNVSNLEFAALRSHYCH